MVGNDIVDLAEARAQSDWKRPGYLAKLFTPWERECIRKSSDPFTMVWSFWSMKEAAYKLYTQIHPGRFFKPHAFACHLHGSRGRRGSVYYGRFECWVALQIEAEYILAEARLEERQLSSEVRYFEEKDAEVQGELLRELALEQVASQKKLSRAQLRMGNSAFGVPLIKHGAEVIPISLTHHGHYGAFALP